MTATSPPTWIQPASDGSVHLRLLVQPKASKSEWVGLHENRLKLRIAAPPVDGEANEEVVRFVKKFLKSSGVREVSILRGDTSKQKDLRLVGATLEALHQAFREVT